MENLLPNGKNYILNFTLIFAVNIIILFHWRIIKFIEDIGDGVVGIKNEIQCRIVVCNYFLCRYGDLIINKR